MRRKSLGYSSDSDEDANSRMSCSSNPRGERTQKSHNISQNGMKGEKHQISHSKTNNYLHS